MTRINVVDPRHLTNEWLLCEFIELLRIPNKIISGKTKLCLKRIPSKYRMGAGHEIFFHDKLKYLHARHDKIKLECIKRGININTNFKFDYDNLPPVAKMFFYNDWTPTKQDHKINIERLQERFTLRKKAYHITVKTITKLDKLVIDNDSDFQLYLMRFENLLK